MDPAPAGSRSSAIRTPPWTLAGRTRGPAAVPGWAGWSAPSRARPGARPGAAIRGPSQTRPTPRRRPGPCEAHAGSARCSARDFEPAGPSRRTQAPCHPGRRPAERTAGGGGGGRHGSGGRHGGGGRHGQRWHGSGGRHGSGGGGRHGQRRSARAAAVGTGSGGRHRGSPRPGAVVGSPSQTGPAPRRRPGLCEAHAGSARCTARCTARGLEPPHSGPAPPWTRTGRTRNPAAVAGRKRWSPRSSAGPGAAVGPAFADRTDPSQTPRTLRSTRALCEVGTARGVPPRSMAVGAVGAVGAVRTAVAVPS